MPLKEIHVLLLDDDPTIRTLMTVMLEEVGVGSVITAGEGQEGLRLLDESLHPLNILICDLTMPGMDGIEFLRHVAARNYGGDVLLFSGAHPSVLKAAKRLATQHGINILDVLEKPVDIDQLANALLRGHHRATSQQRRSQPDQPNLSLEELREGIPHGCIRLHYQPKVSLHDKQIIGVECLARWQHPVRGLLPPAVFITQVEQGGLIDAFTLEVFRIATTQLRAWCDRGLSLRMNINLSMDNLLRVDLPETLEAICQSVGVLPNQIVLEMTESRLISNLKLGLEILIRLRLKGFGLSIDDFGTGFSTMEALKQLPFSELKIDKTFVNGVEEDASTRAILYSSASLGRTLGINVVAEGVETQTDWHAVADAGCDEVQGYFIARPMAATDFENWLAGRRAMNIKEGSMDKQPRVLVVDDDKTSRLLTRHMLSDEFIVDEAASGEEALLVATSLPDLIFMDVDMSPGIDGYETCRRLKADPATASIPIIFVSGNDALEDRLKGYEAGGEDYVAKPFDGVELEAKLRRLLALAEERSSLQEQVTVASQTAMAVMTNMSELGLLLETMRQIAACNDIRSLCDAVLAGLATYGLHGTVQVRTPQEITTLTEGGKATPLETSVISHMASMERITQFKSRLAITYKTVSLLIHNLPVEDIDRCGRLRDHLAMLAEGANARAEAIIATTQAQRCGEVISHASERITATLRRIDQTQRERQCALRIAVENLLSRMQSAFSSITVTMEQEDFITGVVQSGLDQILQIQNDNSDPQEQLTSIVLELEQVLVQARSSS